MLALDTALSVEISIRKQLECMIKSDVNSEIADILHYLIKLNSELELILADAKKVDPNTSSYPNVDIAPLVGNDEDWRRYNELVEKVGTNYNSLVILWSLEAMIEKSAQFYQQASQNSAYSSTKMFLSSLYQVKTMKRRKISALSRIVNNNIWSVIGFSPF
ncbi:hypothetical protein [Dendrosporobacter sp. 1207_IL3150]|uniref:hypothetical protein n=1 Tax=Dendrosporobacter sp. 1207_IL3150 TaxID=3084054 RepID=UPI002FD9B738